MYQLLFTECSRDELQELIIDLISRFEYLPQNKYTMLLDDLALGIVTEPGLNDTNTQLVAMAPDSNADSSQEVLYYMKVKLQQLGWLNHKLVNRYDASIRTYKKSPKHKNILLLDEFVGSGNTVLNRVTRIKSQFAEKNIFDYSIRVRVLVATRAGLSLIKQSGVDISSEIIIDKGISDNYPNSDVNNKLSLMIELESLLLSYFKDRPLPSLGYGKTESLYCRDNGNTPNSVFPIFWWPFYENGEKRIPMLHRAMGDA